jgi:phosphotransferase system enzyme I (PtsP)
MALLGCGLRRLSMSAAAIAPVKQMIRSLEVGELRDLVQHLCGLPDHSVRGILRAYAQNREIPL